MCWPVSKCLVHSQSFWMRPASAHSNWAPAAIGLKVESEIIPANFLGASARVVVDEIARSHL